VLATLVEMGKSVLIPWFEERYDLVVDAGDHSVRIQCKTGSLRNGCIVFKTCITDARRPLGDGGYAGQIDAFGVYCRQTKGVYLVPIVDIPSPFLGYLRVEPPLNAQTSNIRWARDYQIGTWDGPCQVGELDS
jgi:hypothetical protein